MFFAMLVKLKVVEIPGNGGLLEQGMSSVSFLPAFNLEAIPNRDSIHYIDQYNINSVHSIFRGTLRYKVNLFSWLFLLFNRLILGLYFRVSAIM